MKKFLTLLLCLSLMFVLVGCGGSSDTGTTDEEQDTEEVVEEVESDTNTSNDDNYTVGSSISDQGVTVTLDSVTQSTGGSYSTPAEGNIYLILNWTIQNNTGDDYVNLVQFDGFVDGTAVDQTFVSDVAESVSAGETLIDGSNLVGATVYEVPSGWTKFQDRVQIDSTSDVSGTFTITPDQVS